MYKLEREAFFRSVSDSCSMKKAAPMTVSALLNSWLTLWTIADLRAEARCSLRISDRISRSSPMAASAARKISSSLFLVGARRCSMDWLLAATATVPMLLLPTRTGSEK